MKIHISKAGCSRGNLWLIPLQRSVKILQEGVSCREDEPESGGSKTADRIWINFLGQDPLVQAPWDSEEGNQARIWPRPLVITHLPWLGGGRAVLPAELEVACPTSRHPRCTPGFVTQPLCVRRVPLCFLPVHRFCVPTLRVTGACCPDSPATLLLPQNIALITTCVLFGNVRSAFRADKCLLWHLLGLLSSVTPSARRRHTGPFVPSHRPPCSCGSGLCKSHWQLHFPACCWTSIQKYHKQRHFQRALRHKEENKVSKQLHWTPNDI